MGFLSDIKIKRELKKLEAQLLESPSASVYARLADIYAEAEDSLQKAVDITAQGLKTFPRDSALKQVHDKYNKVLLKQEIESIEKKLLNFPSGSLFIKMCEKYYQIGDYERAKNYARTCIREYPDRSAAYIVLGRILRQEGVSAEALQMYEKASMLDRYNYDALMEYGALLEESGNPAKALSVYKSLLFFAPADAKATQKIKALMQYVNDVPAPMPTPEPVPTTSQAPTRVSPAAAAEEMPFNIDFGDRQEPVPAAAAQTVEPVETPAPAPLKTTSLASGIVAMLNDFRGIEGVQGSILVDNYGLIVAEDIQGAFDTDLLGAVLTNMLRTIKQHAAPADFGDFKDGYIETETVNLHLYNIKDIELVIFSTSQTRLGLLEMKVKHFIERFLEIESGL